MNYLRSKCRLPAIIIPFFLSVIYYSNIFLHLKVFGANMSRPFCSLFFRDFPYCNFKESWILSYKQSLKEHILITTNDYCVLSLSNGKLFQCIFKTTWNLQKFCVSFIAFWDHFEMDLFTARLTPSTPEEFSCRVVETYFVQKSILR